MKTGFTGWKHGETLGSFWNGWAGSASPHDYDEVPESELVEMLSEEVREMNRGVMGNEDIDPEAVGALLAEYVIRIRGTKK